MFETSKEPDNRTLGEKSETNFNLKMEAIQADFRNKLAQMKQTREVNAMIAADTEYSNQILYKGWTDKSGVKHRGLKTLSGDELLALGDDPAARPDAQYRELMTAWRLDYAKKSGISQGAMEEYAREIAPNFAQRQGAIAAWDMSEQLKASRIAAQQSFAARSEAARSDLLMALKDQAAIGETAEVVNGAKLPSLIEQSVDAYLDGLGQRAQIGGSRLMRSSLRGEPSDVDFKAVEAGAWSELDGTLQALCAEGRFDVARLMLAKADGLPVWLVDKGGVADCSSDEEATKIRQQRLAERQRAVEANERKYVAQKAREAHEDAERSCADWNRKFLRGELGLRLEDEDDALEARANDKTLQVVAPELAAKYAEWARVRRVGFARGITDGAAAARAVRAQIEHVTRMKSMTPAPSLGDVADAQMGAAVMLDALYQSGACKLEEYQKARKDLEEVLSDNKKAALGLFYTQVGLMRTASSQSVSGVFRVNSQFGYVETDDVKPVLTDEQIAYCVDRISSEIDALEKNTGGKVFAPEVVDGIVEKIRVEVERDGFNAERMGDFINRTMNARRRFATEVGGASDGAAASKTQSKESK